MLDESSNVFQKELRAGERLLWAGKPAQGFRLQGADLFMIPFSLLWGGGIIFIAAQAIQDGATWILTLILIPFVLMALYVLVGRFFFDAWQRARTHYAVTDRRALISSGIFSRNLRSLGAKALSDIIVTTRDERRGTITFGTEHPWAAWRSGFGWAGMSGFATPRFEMIDDARHVYDLLIGLQVDGH